MDRKKYDVIVTGGGPAGMAAAVSAARAGASTLIIEKNSFLGGCAASGLPYIDFFSSTGEQLIAGAAEELMRRLNREGASLGHIRTGNGHLNSITMIDPEWVKICGEEMLLEAGCSILYNSFVCKAQIQDNTLASVFVANKAGISEFSADCFVDATGDGDTAAFAGADFEKGRPEDGLMQAMSLLFRLVNVDVKTATGLFDRSPIVTLPKGTDETYNVHINGTLSRWNDILEKEGIFDHPDHNLWAGTLRHNELTYVNTVRVAGKDGTDPWQLTAAEMEGRRQLKSILRFLNKNVPGFEKAYIGAVQNSIGVRETRRITGVYTLTGDDVVSGRKFEDGVGKNGYCIDIHDPRGKGWTSTAIQSPDASYDIPYRCLVPATLDGLLVAGRCVSTTHEALASIRIMPSCMATGQAAGTAAAMAAAQKAAPRSIDTGELRARLIKDGAIL